MSILRHDTRHHMAVLRTLIQQGDCEKALEYLNEVSQTYDDTVIKAYCRNEMVNSVLSTYNTRFEEQKIPWDTQVTIGEKLPCSEMMFCAILSNVLENAMHAVQELPESRRRIELSLSEKAGHLLLMVKNPVQIMPVFTDGIPGHRAFRTWSGGSEYRILCGKTQRTVSVPDGRRGICSPAYLLSTLETFSSVFFY